MTTGHNCTAPSRQVVCLAKAYRATPNKTNVRTRPALSSRAESHLPDAQQACGFVFEFANLFFLWQCLNTRRIHGQMRCKNSGNECS